MNTFRNSRVSFSRHMRPNHHDHNVNLRTSLFRNIPKVFAVFFVVAIALGVVQMAANPQTQVCTMKAKWASRDNYTMLTSCGFMTPHPFNQSAFFDMEQGATYRVETTGFIIPVVHNFEVIGS